MYGRIQNAIESKSAQLGVVFVLVARSFGDLHHHANHLWEGGSWIEIVQGGAHRKNNPTLSGGIAKPFVK
jgi:hypothetical protein